MDVLWEKRLKDYFKMNLKYLRLVFNDHFVIALLFMAGAMGYAYSQYLKGLPKYVLWWQPLLVALILSLFLLTGQLSIFLKKADKVFLLPRQYQVKRYISKGYTHSWLVDILTQTGLFILLVPLLLVGLRLSVFGIICIYLSQCLLKTIDLDWQFITIFSDKVKSNRLTLFLSSWLLYLIGLYFYPVITTILVILIWLLISYYKKKCDVKDFNWNLAINIEEQRILKIYRFYNMFTDVPNITIHAKRRKFMDRLLPKVKVHADQLYVYLFARGLVRNGEYSGIYLRLSIIGILFLIFIGNLVVSVIISLLLIYLTGFQIVPLYSTYDEIVFTHLYPISLEVKRISFSKTVLAVLSIQAICFGLSAIVGLGIINGLIILVINLLFAWLLTKTYLQVRVKKSEKYIL